MFNGSPVDGDPLSYNTSNREFTVYSDDDDGDNLIGEIYPYQVLAHFTKYPVETYSTVSTAVATANVEFNNPCLAPFDF